MTYSIKVLNWQGKLNIKLLLLCHWKFSTSHLIDFRFKPDIITCNYFISIWAPQQADGERKLLFLLLSNVSLPFAPKNLRFFQVVFLLRNTFFFFPAWCACSTCCEQRDSPSPRVWLCVLPASVCPPFNQPLACYKDSFLTAYFPIHTPGPEVYKFPSLYGTTEAFLERPKFFLF